MGAECGRDWAGLAAQRLRPTRRRRDSPTHSTPSSPGLGIPLATLDEVPTLDLAIDGADEVDPELNLVKGRGGALLREKMVELQSAKFVCIVDESKLVAGLGGSKGVWEGGRKAGAAAAAETPFHTTHTPRPPSLQTPCPWRSLNSAGSSTCAASGTSPKSKGATPNCA